MTRAPEQPRSLRRILGVGFGIAVGVGTMIGAGILRAPADVALRLPTPALFLLVWVVGGIYALLGANAVAELAVLLPRSGGQYVYAREAFGPYVAFVVGWNDWLSTSASASAIAIAFAESASLLVTGTTRGVAFGAGVTVAAATALLLRGMRVGDRTQRLTSAAKAVALLALVAACVILPRVATPTAAAPPRAPSAAAFVLALQGVIYAYDGWTGPIYFTGELRDPAREVPRALFGGVLSVLALYVAVNAAFLAVLPVSAMAGSTLVAADVARALLGPRGAALVHAIVVVALPSAIIACLLEGSRVAYAMGRDGAAPARLSRLSRADIPAEALVVTSVVAAAFAATGAFERVIAICAFLFVAGYVVSFAAVFVLRRRLAQVPREHRAWGHPWTTALALAGSIAFLAGVVVADPRGAAIALGCVVVTAPVYVAMRRVRERSTVTLRP